MNKIEQIIEQANYERAMRPVKFWDSLRKKLSYLRDNNYTARILFDWLAKKNYIEYEQ